MILLRNKNLFKISYKDGRVDYQYGRTEEEAKRKSRSSRSKVVKVTQITGLI